MTSRYNKILIHIMILKTFEKKDIFRLNIHPLITIYLEESQPDLDLLSNN